MKLGYIVHQNNPLLERIDPSEIDSFVNKKPILIVGVEAALSYYPQLSLSSNIIDEDKQIYYIYSPEESEESEQQLNQFLLEQFKQLTKSYRIISINNLSQIKLNQNEIFVYENNSIITITTGSLIYFINKEIYNFFNSTSINTVYIVSHLKSINKHSEIISWSCIDYFQAYLKTTCSYKPIESIKISFKPYIDVETYMGVICLKWLEEIKPQKSESNELSLWNRAYDIENYLSSLKIKINEEKLKSLTEDNPIVQSIYENIQGGYVYQKYNGTDKITGRMYVKDSNFSLQTLSKKLRDLIIAEKDCVLIEFDYDYFEYFLLSQICNLNLEGDPHLEMSKMVFKDELHRNQGKGINYGLLYGQSIDNIIKGLMDEGIEVNEELKNTLYEIIKPLEKFKAKLLKELIKQGYIYNYFSRKIYVEKDYACLNNYIQSTATDLFIIKLQKLRVLLKKYPNINRIVLQNHDSVLLNLNIETIEESSIVDDIIKLLEEKENKLYGKVSFKYGYDWKNIK